MQDRERKKRRRYRALLAMSGLTAVLTFVFWQYVSRTFGDEAWKELQSDQKYDRHYVMIADDTSSLLWQDIYQNAKEAAAKSGAFLELSGNWNEEDYSLSDYMNIAIAAKVDGIILKPDDTVKLRQAIDRAEEAGIPVITVLEDDSASSRKSFVGVNSYQIGTIYGRQVLECIDKDTENITVLLNRADAGKDLVYKQLRATVQEGLKEGQKVEIGSLTFTPGTPFGSEELIRDLLQNENGRPDILVCMSETESECAYYAMVDYNQVGSVKLIGYYQSASMLSAVQKGVIPMVVTIDTQQVGAYSIEALEEYYSMGYVSSYFSVDLDIITKENVGTYQEAEET